MELDWFACIIYGLISGIAEFLPISALAHQTVYLQLLGMENHPYLQFSASFGAFLAVLIFAMPVFLRLQRERRMAAMPRKHRRRQPDFPTLMESRAFRMASLSMIVIYLVYSLVSDLHDRLWVLAILIGINGIILYIPQYMPGANKSAQSLSGLDAMLIGLAAGCGIVPGMSRVGCTLSCALIRGTERRYAMDLALLLSVPALLVMMLIQLFAGLTSAGGLGSMVPLNCVLVTAASFASGYFAVFLMRFLSVKALYGGFAYYCWGLSLFSLIIYLI